MLYPVNRPTVLSSSGISGGTLTVITLPSATAWAAQQGAYAGVGAGQSPLSSLVLCDAATFDDASPANAIMTIPFDRLSAGDTLPIPATSIGLTISSVPPACAINIDIP